MARGHIIAFTVVALVASLTAPGAWAQAFTFGGNVSDDDVRARPDRKAKAQQARHCRLERHQIYDARGQLIWRTLKVCG